MLELSYKPPDIDGIKPCRYEEWYYGSSRALKRMEYHRRSMAIIENMDLTPGMRVLDINCDWGYLLILIKKKFKNLSCYGIDISEHHVKFANEIAALNGYRIQCECQDVRSINYQNNFFDCIVSTGAFDHLPPKDHEIMLKECLRILKPGSCIIMTTPYRYCFSEIVKRPLAKPRIFKRLVSLLSEIIKKGRFFPQGATNRDDREDISETITPLRGRLTNAGFSVVARKYFIFMPDIANPLCGFSRFVEYILQHAKILNFFANAQLIKARKNIAA